MPAHACNSVKLVLWSTVCPSTACEPGFRVGCDTLYSNRHRGWSSAFTLALSRLSSERGGGKTLGKCLNNCDPAGPATGTLEFDVDRIDAAHRSKAVKASRSARFRTAFGICGLTFPSRRSILSRASHGLPSPNSLARGAVLFSPRSRTFTCPNGRVMPRNRRSRRHDATRHRQDLSSLELTSATFDGWTRCRAGPPPSQAAAPRVACRRRRWGPP